MAPAGLRWLRWGGTFLLVGGLFGCEGDEPRLRGTAQDAEPALAVTDDAGHRVTLPGRPRRVVSLVPSATAVLQALGAADRLVGRTDYDTASALASLPSVGGGLEPSLEVLLELEPDLVVRFAGESDPATPRQLDDLGIPHLAVRPDGIADIRRIVRTLGRAVGEEARADSLVAAMDGALHRVAERVAGLEPVRVAYLTGGDPPWVAGPGTFIDELLRVAGGVNAFGDLERLYAPVGLEALIVRDVDLFLVAEGTPVDPALERKAPVAALPATVQTPGPWLGELAERLARTLHPRAFPELP